MAEIKVNIKGDDSDVKAKFQDAASAARIFKESAEKSLEAVNAASKTLISETGLGGVAKLFGAAGLVGAAEEFTKRMVGGFKDAVGAALDFQGQIGKLRSALGPALAGQAEDLVNWVDNVSAAFGGLEKNLPIFENLIRGGFLPEEAKRALIDIQNAAKATGIDIEALGMAFAEMKERGEVPERFFKEFPQLAPIARGLGGGEHPTADWMLHTLLPNIAPGGLYAPGRLRAETSIGGQIATNQAEFNRLWRELGTDLLPAVNEALKGLKTEMPDIKSAFHDLSQGLKEAIPPITQAIHFLLGKEPGTLQNPPHPFGEPLKPIHDFLEKAQDDIFNFFKPENLKKLFTHEPLTQHEQSMHDLLFHTAEKVAKFNLDSAEKLNRALDPK